MRALMPRDPFCLSVSSRLALPHLLDELVVNVPIVLRTAKLGHDDHVVVTHGFAVPLSLRHCDHPHLRSRLVIQRHIETTVDRVITELGIACNWSQQLVLLHCRARSDHRNRDVPAAVTILIRMRVHTSDPPRPNFPADRGESAVGLREEQRLLGAAAQVGNFAHCAERQAHHAVVPSLGPALELADVVNEGLLADRLLVPRDADRPALLIDGQVLADLPHGAPARRQLPELPLLALLQRQELLFQLFADAEVLLGAVEVWHNEHIVRQ
mmetsp:Transcript_133968/g.428101  ORF Transcript_133968/g.428101 Transcript_133968/m.428101 type:complete len:269 (+) Transcript_133968:481-1287(+)